MQNGFLSMKAAVIQAHRTKDPGYVPRRPRKPPLAFFFVLVALGWLSFDAPPTLARVNPLVVIQRQLHKANMLIVLDTSGSMTGVPGGNFSSGTEAGVDCDNGTNCRNGGTQGTCVGSGRNCQSDDDCRHGYCQKDGISICAYDSDCPQELPTCSVTRQLCTQDSDCPVQSGTCSASGVACSTGNPCATVGKCKYTNAVCANPGGSCPNVTVCAQATSVTCANPAADCPPLPGAGTCVNGNTPRHGCYTLEDCPPGKQCNVTQDPCRIDTDCPSPPTGLCASNGAVCNKSNKKCAKGDTCVYAAQACSLGSDNTCNLPVDSCVTKTDNTCDSVSNTCSAASNTCVTPTANICVPPASPTDTCVESVHGPLGPIRMCRLAQTVCRNNSDCGSPGDACGPATSRAVIAKRAISSIVNSNYKMLNFGLMTYYQSGYFPYSEVESGGGTTSPVQYFAPINMIANSGCWNNHTGPAQTCVINGVTMTLPLEANSRYRVRTAPSVWIEVNVNWCGHHCDMPGDLGRGQFVGANYEYAGVVGGGNSGNMIVQPTYSGPVIQVGGKTYVYYQPLNNYYNGGTPPPIDVPSCGSACGARCGGRWDTQLAPFLSTLDDLDISLAAAQAISTTMAPAANGGLLFYWGTPTGCTLLNDVSQTIHTSAYVYMNAVKNGSMADGIPADHLGCRNNYILLITDGAANGPGDNNCEAAACAAANPVTAGCQCRSVLAAYRLKQELGVQTFVVGFSGDVSGGTPAIINDNIARAGGTDADNDGVAPYAYTAQNEDQLNTALQLVIYNAVKGSYSTAPTSTSAGTQQATTVAEGRYALDSRMDFPSWKGHLLAYDLAGATPTLAWDAYQKLTTTNWWQRRIYTWDGTNMVKITVDPDTRAITNADQLATIGLGNTATEAAAVARWLLGDPTYGNPHVLGAIINSTPIDVASPGDIPQPGGHAFYLQHQNRPHLIYVGASDGLLHAFFLQDTTIGSTTFQAGTEAFAFLPPDMMTAVRNQYSQGGQKPDPRTFIFGLADSPKVKSLCVQNCSSAATAVWKTLLVMPEGYGGSNTFMLDVTSPFSPSGIADPPVTVQWHTGYGSSAATYRNLLGNTISLPAFFFNKTTEMDDYRIAFTSGYPVTHGSMTQGRAMITASAANGSIITSHALTPGSTCAQEYSALTDFATARDFAKNQANKLVAGYFGDTSGQLFRYLVGSAPTVAQSFTCNYPLHFSPTVVQLDRDSLVSGFSHQIFPVQVTNSNLDLDTAALPASTMVFLKETATADDDGNITSVAKDESFGNGGQITLTVGVDNQICGVTQTDAHGVVTCLTPMPATARPTSTPLGILLADASGFEILTMWYVPPVDACTRGQTYLTIHRMTASTGTITQKLGAAVASEPVTSPIILGGRVYIFGSSGAIEITNLMPSSIVAGRAVPTTTSATGNFIRYSWTEVL